MNNKEKKIYAVIPARYGSTRLPGKVLFEIMGKPIIQHVYENVKKSELVNEIIIATDDERISEVVKSFGGNVVLTPSELKSGSDRIAFVMKDINQAKIVVNVQGDEPFIASNVIDGGIKLLLEDDTIVVATPINRIKNINELNDPNIVKVVVDKNWFALYFSRSPIPFIRDNQNKSEWLKSHTYYKHIGLYVYRRDFLIEFNKMKESNLEMAEKLEQLRIIENGYKIKTYLTDYESISVDTLEDYNRIKNIFK